MNKELTCAQRLDNAFNAAQKLHQKIISRVISGKYEHFIETQGDGFTEVKKSDINYRDIPNLPPTAYLNELKIRWRHSGDFKAEIESNWLSANIEYFSYLRFKMTRHYNFLLKNCRDGIEFYKVNSELTQNLIYRLNHTGTVLTKNELILAMQLSFVNLFTAFEDIIIQNYTGYTRLLDTENGHETIPAYDYIHLQYGVKNDEVIEKLYAVFAEKFIDIDFNAFKAHFKPASELLPKIKWKETQSLLCTVFSGVILPKKNILVPKVEVSTIDLPEMIAEHFCHSNGENFNKEILRSTINKLGEKAVRKIDMLLPTLQNIEKGYRVL